MTPEIAVNLISLLGAIAVAVWFFNDPWQTLITDIVRQNLFEVRDKVMTYSCDNGIDLSSDEYQAVRNQFNTLIRFAHEMRISRMIAYVASGAVLHKEKHSKNPIDTFSNDRAREFYLKKWNEAIEYIVYMIWLRSPILMMATMLLLPIFIIEHLLNKKFFPAVQRSVRALVNKEVEIDRMSERVLHQTA